MRIFIIVSLFILQACTYSIHQHSFDGFDPYSGEKAGKAVHIQEEERFIVANFGDMRLVDKAYSQLLNSCPNGKIAAPSVMYKTAHSFISWTDTIVMEGKCL